MCTEATSVPLLGETIGAALNRTAAQFAERDALISCHQDAGYTYAELLEEVNRAARGLLALEVVRGDRIGIWSPNAADWMISEVQVIGVRDLKYGEEVCAWVRLSDGQNATEDEMGDCCRRQIATYKIPRSISFSTEFPTTVTGKIQKFRMGDLGHRIGIAVSGGGANSVTSRESSRQGRASVAPSAHCDFAIGQLTIQPTEDA